MAKILIIRLDGVGDACAVTPLLAALYDAGHGLGIVTTRINSGLLRPEKLRSHCCTSDMPLQALVAELRAEAYDIALIATEKAVGYELAVHAGIPRRVGFWNGWGKPLKSMWLLRMLHHRVYRPLTIGEQHEVEALFVLGSDLHPEALPTSDAARLRPFFIGAENAAADRPRGTEIVVQVTEKLQRYFQGSSLAEVLAGITRPWRCIGAAGEAALVNETARACGVGATVFSDAQAWLQTLDDAPLLITPDTGAAHAAGMIGTPVLDIFAAGTEPALMRRWRPWATRYVARTADILRNDPQGWYDKAAHELNGEHAILLDPARDSGGTL